MSAGCEAVIGRLANDEQFRRAFESDRNSVLQGFDLTGEERADLLAFQVELLQSDPSLRRRAKSVCAMKGGLGEY